MEADWLAALSEFVVSAGDRAAGGDLGRLVRVVDAGGRGRETIAVPESSATGFQDAPKAS
jgi:hypothetical protein